MRRLEKMQCTGQRPQLASNFQQGSNVNACEFTGPVRGSGPCFLQERSRTAARCCFSDTGHFPIITHYSRMFCLVSALRQLRAAFSFTLCLLCSHYICPDAFVRNAYDEQHALSNC